MTERETLALIRLHSAVDELQHLSSKICCLKDRNRARDLSPEIQRLFAELSETWPEKRPWWKFWKR